MALTVITDNGNVDVPNATEWTRESDGSRTFYNSDGDRVAEFDRENFVAVVKDGDSNE